MKPSPPTTEPQTHSDPGLKYRAFLQQTRLPVAFIDLDALEANADEVLKRAGNLPVRLATKSIRCREIIQHLLNYSERFQGLMCYTAAEAAWLLRQGFDDVLVAYPSVDREALGEICALSAQGKRVYVMIDCPAQARLLNGLAAQAQTQLSICLDVDMSSDFPGLHFGVWRSPLRDLKSLRALVDCLKAYPQLKIAALMGYEAQIAGVGDLNQGIKEHMIRVLQRKSMKDVMARRSAAVQWLQEAGHSLELVNGGGSGSLDRSAQDASITELTAGSAFYNPVLFDHYRSLNLQPAAFFAMPVVRKPSPEIVTCLGGGYLASGAIGPDRQPQVWSPPGANLTPLEGAGEVQTPITGAAGLQVGDPVIFRHAKAGELCERFNELQLLRGGQRQGCFLSYRGEGQCFL